MKHLQILMVLLLSLTLGLWACSPKKEGADKNEPKKKEKVEKKAAESPEEAPQTTEKAEDEAPEAEETPETTPPTEEENAEVVKTGDDAAKATEEQEGDKPEEDAEPESTIVAKVNGVEIDAAEHIQRLRKRFRGKVNATMLRKTIVDRMINDELLEQEIEKLKIDVSDEELAEAMKMEVAEYRSQKDELETKANVYRKRIAERKLLETRGLLEKPTEVELKKQYQREFSVHLQTITIPIRADMTDEDKTKAQEMADEILTEVKGGTTFQEAVKERKDLRGRRLIVKPLLIKKGARRHADLWTVADKLAEKAFGGPVETSRGIVVFQVIRKRIPKKSFKDMKVRLENRVLNMKVGQARHRLLKDLRDAAKIEYLIDFKNDPTLRNLGNRRLKAPRGRHRMGKGKPLPKALRKLPKGPAFRGKGPGKNAPEKAPENAPAAE